MTYTKNQLRYLAQFKCGWCDHPLNRKGCGAVYGKCNEEVRERRKTEWLKTECVKKYKPRG